MSDRRRRWSPESSRRRRKAKRDSREQLVLDDPSMAPPDSRSVAPPTATESTFTSSYSHAYPGGAQSQGPSSSFQYPSAQLPDQQPLPGGPGGPITMRSNDDIRSSAPMPMPGPSRGHDGGRDPRPTRRSRRGSPSSSDAMSLSSSSSSSYLDISRWYPSYGRSGGVLNAFFKTPSERQQRVRRRRSLKKKNRGIFAFGNNSSSSSVNSDMAYGMGFVKKPKSRTLSPHRERAATLERLEGRPAQAQRRQTDEEILEIGRKLAKVARDSNREDLRAMGGKRPSSQFSAAQETWDKYSRHNSGGYAASSRGIALSKNGRQSSSSSSDDEWESASEGEYSSDESNSGLAYGAAVDLGRSSPPKSTVSRQSTHISARPPEDIRPPDRKSSAVDPRLFGPVNSLRGLINTPCGHGDRNSAYTVPGPSEQRYAGSAGTAESASIEARPMQTVYPIQTSDPSRVDAARGSGSLVSSHPSFSALSREPSHSSRRPEPLPIQAPKPIAPVPNSMYDEQRIRDSEQRSPRESRIKPNENKTFAETALVGAGVAALGAAIMAGRDKGKGKEKMKERDPERRQERHERYGHDDHRDEDTVVQDSRRAKELALEKEIERLERALSDRNKAREQRRRDSKRDSMPELSGSREADADAERDHEKRRRDRDSRYSEPDYSYGRPETSRRVSEPGKRPEAVDDGQTRRPELPAVPSSSGVDVSQFQVSDDAFRTRDSPLRAASPVIIDVTPAPSPPLEEDHRKSRRESFEDELRDAKHIYDESMHSTAPISAVDMAAAIAATERARHRDEPERGRTLTKTQDIIQEEANAYYHARRMAEREVSSRSRSKSDERSIIEKYDKDRDNESQGAKIVRIVTPPEMKQKPQKHKYSEPNADFRFDNLMSPKDFDYFRPHEYLVRDPSAERPRPLLNLVIPTPVPTPTPDSQKKKSASSKSPEPVVEVSEREVPDVVTTSKGEVVEAQQTPTSKRVSWEPSETQQYDAESPDWSSERNSRSYERPRSSSQSSGWGATAAAVAGIAAAAALSKDDEPESSGRDSRARDSTGSKSSEGSRSPPSRKILPKGTAPSRVLEEEPDDVPPAPGPKPASPRSSQMPGAFADDLDFAATLAAGLQDTGFDPNIVIEDATYRRRDSPPGSNEHTGVYMQPFSETVTDLGVNDIDDGARPSRGSGYVIGELADTPASEKGSSTFDWAEGSERRQSKSEKRRSAGSGSFEAVQGPEEESPKLSKKEQRKIEKAARAAKLAEEEDRSSRPAEAAEDDWEDASTSRRSKRSSKKSKRTSVAWDDADMPVNDRRVSVPVDAFDDLDDTKPGDNAWDKPQRTNKSKRNSKGYDMPDDTSDRRERRREERRRSELYEPLDRDVTSVVSDIGHDDRSNGRDRDRHDDERSVVSAPDGKRDSKSDKRSSKEEKRSSGGFWGLLKGSNGADGEKQSKKDNAGTLGAGAGVAGAVAVASIAAGSLSSRSDAAAAPLDQEETQHIIVDAGQPSERRADIPSRGINVFDFQDPEITPRVIKPAIDPQYGDFLPLPPSPSDEQNLDFDVGDDLPSLPDSRPGTPPGQEKLVREKRDSSQKRPATHSRRRSAYEMPLKSPSHTAIPITFRMGQRSSVPVSPRVVSNPVSAHQSPAVQTPETFSSPSTKRSPRPPSWDRPTSWESTREIKPLYLIERSAHTSGDSAGQEHDDRAENTPLPPSRESNAPEFGDVGGDIEQEARILESAPLFVDTAVARAVPLGSQETTPKGFTQTDSGLPDSAREFGSVPQGTSGPSHIDSGLPHSAKEVDNTLLMEGPHHQSPLLESTYATPTGSPPLRPEARPGIERDESTESSSDFKDALDRLALDEDTDRGQLQDISRGVEVEQPTYTADPSSVDKKDGPGYLSSALSMLPTGLVGVGALLGRGSRNNASASVDEQPSQGTHGDAAKSVHQPGETSAAPEFEARQAIVTPHINTDEQGQAQSAASVGFSRPYTPADTIKGTDISAPSNSPATHMRLEETLPTSNPQEIEDVSSGVKGLEAEQEAFVTDATSVPLPASPLQSLDNYLISSPKLNPEDKETLPETPVEAVEWPEQSTSKKKKGKKGKKKQSSISASSIPLMAEPSAGLSSDVQLDTPTQEDTSVKMIEEPASKTTEEPSFVPQDTTTLSNEPSRQILEPGIEPGFPKGGDQDISSTPYQILGDSEGKGLSDEPQNLPDTIEAPTLPGIVTQVQTQDEKPQTGDRSRRSSSATRRLRSSRSSTLPHGSIGRPGSPDVFHSGDEGLVSPPGAAVSACSPAENENEETRPIGSSRRLSLASLPGSGRGHQPGSGEIVAFDQPGSSFEEPQEFHDFEQSSPKHHQGVQRNVESPLEVVEQRVPSPLTAVGEHTSDQLELHVDPQAKTASAVDPSAFAVAEPLTNDVQRVGSPSVGDLQRPVQPAESSAQEARPSEVQSIVEHILPTSPQIPRVGDVAGLPSESLDESPFVLGSRSFQDPPSAGDEAIQLASEPIVEEQPPEEHPTDVSGGVAQRSELDPAVHDGLQQKVESPPQVSSVEQIEEPSSSISVGEPIQSLPMPSSPTLGGQGPSELERSTFEHVTEPELQEPGPALASTEDDNAFFTQKSKKNKKKRKSSTILGGTFQSSGTTTPAQLESNTQPVEASVEPTVSHKDDVLLRELSTPPKDTLEVEQQPVGNDFSDLQVSSKSMEPEIDSSRLTEPVLPVSDDKSLTESIQTTQPTVLPVLEYVPAEVALSELEKPHLRLQEKLGDVLDEVEIARREAEDELIRDEEAEMSRLQSKKKLKPKEKTRLKQLKANADQRAEEAAILAETSSPTQPKISGAQLSESSIQPQVSGAQLPDSSIQQPVLESQVEEPSLPMTEEPILTNAETGTGSTALKSEVLPSQLISGSEEAVPISKEIVSQPSEDVTPESPQISGTSPTSGHFLPRLDEPIEHGGPQPEMEATEDPEDVARREAEAFLIRDEEAELTRLEGKKKPNKKDKARMKILRSNSERRAQEADAAAQSQNAEQDAVDLDMPVPEVHVSSSSQQQEDWSREPLTEQTEYVRTDDPQSLGDMIQTSDAISTSTQPPVESSIILPESDFGATSIEESTQVQPQMHDLSLVHAGDSPSEATAGTGSSQLAEILAERSERQIDPESTHLDSTRPGSAQLHIKQLDSAVPEIVEVPQNRDEDIHFNPGSPLDDSQIMKAPQSLPRRDSLPHIEETVTDPIGTPSHENDGGIPENQIEDFSQDRHGSPSLETKDHFDFDATRSLPGQASQVSSQEPVLVSDITEEAPGTDINSPLGEPGQPAVTVTELPEGPESEWSATTKKSKKDKKKKRKGTISEGSGQNSGTATPFFDAKEQSPIGESRGLPETELGSRGEDPLRSSFEPVTVEHSQQPGFSFPLDGHTAKDSSLDGITAPQPLDASVPEQQESSLSLVGSVPAPGTSDDNLVSDLMGDTSVARPLESNVTEPHEVTIEHGQQPVSSLASEETTATQPLDASIPERQESSLSTGGSVQPPGFSDDNIASDLVEDASVARLLESNVAGLREVSPLTEGDARERDKAIAPLIVPEPEPEQVALAEELEFQPVSKKSKKDKKKNRKNTISEDLSLPSGSATPVTTEEPEQSSSLAETALNFESGQPVSERSLPLDMNQEPSKIEGTSETRSPVLETTEPAEKLSLPYSTSEEPSTSLPLGDISASIPEPEPEQSVQEEASFFTTKSKKDKKRKKTLPGTITPMDKSGEVSLPGEPSKIQDTSLESTQRLSSPPLPLSEPERIASGDFSEARSMPTELAEVRSPTHLPEEKGQRPIFPLGSKAEDSQVELGQLSRPSRKSDGWGFHAGAIAGAGVGSSVPQSHDIPREQEAVPEDITSGQSPIQSVGPDTLVSRLSLSFADVVETATTSDSKDQEQSQFNDISRDQTQSSLFSIEDRGQSDDIALEPRPSQDDTSHVISAPKESQSQESGSLNLGVGDVGPPSTQFSLEEDIKHEEGLPSDDLVQGLGNTERAFFDHQDTPREEHTTISEPQTQIDDWTQASSSKKKRKKDKKRKNSNIPWSETESSAHTPVTGEPSKTQGAIIDTDERSASLDAGGLGRPRDSLATQPEPLSEFQASETENRVPLGDGKLGEEASFEGESRSGNTEIAKDIVTSPILHSTVGDRDEAFVEARDQAHESPSSRQIQEGHTSGTLRSPVLSPNFDNRNEPLITATPFHEDEVISSRQSHEPSDRQVHGGFTPDTVPASTEDFATPLQLPAAIQELDAQLTPLDGQLLATSTLGEPSHDNTQIGTELSRSLAPELEASSSVTQIPAELADAPAEESLEPAAEDLWEPIPRKLSKKEKRKAKKGSISTSVPDLTTSTAEGDSQQISEEPAPGAFGIPSRQDSPNFEQVDEPVVQEADKMGLRRSLEPENEQTTMPLSEEQPSQAQDISVVDTPILSRKMSKKEKREAKKSSLSAWEDDIVERGEPSQSQTPTTVETQAQDMPTPSSPILRPELEQSEATQISGSAEPRLEQEVSEAGGQTSTHDAAAEDEWAAPISRKKSKKDKKKKGKQSSSGSISGTQTPVIVEAPIQHAAEAVESGEPISERPGTPSQPLDASQTPVAKESPVEHGIDAVQSIGLVPERPGTPSQPTDVSQIESHRYQGPPEIDISSPDNTRGLGPSVHATEDASAFEGRMRHRSAEMYLPLDNTNDGELAGPSEDARKSSRRGDHRSAELYVPGGDPGLEVHRSTPIEDDWDKPSDDQFKNDNKYSSLLPDKTPTLNTPMGRAHNIDKYHDEASKTDAEGTRFLRSPDGRGKELERMRPSPDLWDNEDYFKPKPANYVEPDQEAFSKFDIHPAVARGLNTSPDKRGAEERPLVGLGLIHRHSSIFQEDEGHVPKLLTMTSDNVSTDSIAVQEVEAGPSGESSQLGGWTRSATVPEPPDSSRSYDEGLNPAVKQVNTKQWFTFETGPAHGANVPLARSVSPDSLRPVSPGLPRSPQFPPPRSPQLSAQPSPRSPHFPPPSPRSPHYSPRDSTSFEAARDPTKKVGSVAALAEKFGGGKKATGKTGTISDYFDNRNPRDDDFFDEPAMWEDAEHKPLRVSRLDVDSGDHWAVHHTKLEGEQPDPDMHHSGQEAAATSHGREPTTPGSDNVSEPCSQPDIDAGTFTPQIPDQASREAEIPLEYVVVESPVLGSQTSVEFPTDERKPQVKSPRELPDAAPFPPENTEDAALHEFLYQPHDSSTTHSRSPALKISSPGEVTPSIEARDETEPAAGQSIGGRVDYGHPLSIGLPPVQEEPHEEEAEVNERALLAGPRAVTPDANRDSGVVTGSPVPPRVHKFEIAEQQRDSGVHMREPSGASPRLLGARAFSPQPARLSHSSIEDGGGDHDDKSSKMSSAGESEAQRRFKEATPVLEAQDVPVTPEPRKSRSKVRKYPDLGPSPGKKAVAAALAGGGALLAADTARSRTPSPSPSPAASQRSVSDVTDELRASALPRQRRAASSNAGISRTRTPEPLSLRAESPSLLRHSGTPPLRSRRTRSGDLRSLSQLSNRSHSDLGAQTSSSPASAVSAANKGPTAHPSSATPTPTPASSDLRRATTPAAAVAQGTNNPPPTANEGRVRSKDMADVYDGVGEGRLGSPRSPTRPHSMRRRQSMQVLELESRVEQLAAENRALQDARAQAEAYTTNRATSTLAERDTEIEALKQTLNFMRKEVQRLTEVNQGLNSAIQQHAVQHDDRYRLLENQHELLESQHAEVTRELLEHRGRDGSYTSALEIKDQEIKSLREQLEATKEQIREMQKQILDTKPADSDFLRIKDVDYFDHRCQQLCSHVQQWVLRFSKFSDMRACRLTSQLNDEKIIDRLDNAVLDGSNVDHYLNDRVRRRDVFMSVTMTMIWEFVFTRYLFGMDREQRQKLKNLEKLLLEVGPPHAVRQWRAVTLTLLSRREPFKDQRDQDTEAVVQAVFQTLSMILPPPSNLEDQIQGQLRKVMREAVDLSVEMRTQRAEYMMLPPLQPEYDANGDLAEPHPFNSALMNERSGDKNAATDNDELEAQGAVVRVVLFPLVVKKGDDEGMGDDEVVVCPAQVIVARPRSKSRHSHRAPSSDAGGVSLLRAGSPSTAPNRSNVSMADAPGVAPGMEGAI